MCLTKEKVNTINNISNYNPKEICNCMNSGKISLFMTLVDKINKDGGIIGYSKVPCEERKAKDIQSEIPDPLSEPIIEYISKVELGYFYNLTFDSNNRITGVNIRFSSKEKIEEITEKKNIVQRDALDGYLFGYPEKAIEQYKSETNLRYKYKNKLIDIKQKDRISTDKISYLVSFIQYIPKLDEDNIIKTSEKGKERYNILKHCCSEYELNKMEKIIDEELEKDRKWAKSIGE